MDKEEKLICSKCGSAALGAVKTNIPSASSELRDHLTIKCLNCGSQFVMAVKKDK